MRFLYFIVLFCISSTDGLTRYTCMTSALGAAGLFLDSSEEEGGLARSSMSGSLSCSTKQNTKILVSRIIHGFGNFRGCANPDESCDKEVYSDTMIAAHCDGKVSCFVQTFPKWLEKCSMISDFVHVEYECVFDSSIFDVCRETTQIVSDTAVYIVSPNVFQSSGPSSRQIPVCECMINSRYSDQIMVDYIHSDVYSNGNQCSDSYILLESKLVPNQTTVDKEVEVCGRRTVSNQMFRGTVRLSYYNRRSAADDGFLTKFRVPPLEIGAELRMQCGPVRSPGDDNRNPPQARGPGYNSFRSSPTNRQSLWSSPFNPTIPQFVRPPFPFFGATLPPMFGPEPPGWRNPGTRNTNGRTNPWGSTRDNQYPPSNSWNNPNIPPSASSNTSPWETSNRNSNQNRPWPNPSSGNTQNFNDPSLQVPRDPRRFMPQSKIHTSPSADQLGITHPAPNSTSSKKLTSRIDPRLTITNANDNSLRSKFIPWTNSKRKPRKDFIPWTPVRSNLTSTKVGRQIPVPAEHTTLKPPNGTTRTKLPSSVQFLGSGQTLKMTSRQPGDPVLPPPLALPGLLLPPPPPPQQYVTNEKEKTVSSKGSAMAYIIGGIGAGLIGLCVLAFFFLYTKRRRALKALKRESEDVEQNNHDSMSDDPTYALPSDVSFRPPYRCHDNEAYDEGNQICGTEITQTEDIYSTPGTECTKANDTNSSSVTESTRTVDIQATRENNVSQDRVFTVETQATRENDVSQNGGFTVETQTIQTYTDTSHSEASIYDNNFEN